MTAQWVEWVSFARIWVPLELASLLSLWIGARLTGHPILVRIGRTTYRRKKRAVERIWPLTRLPAALEEGRVGKVTVILASLVTLKSLVCLAFGSIMVIWLPFAAVVVPSILQVHERSGPELTSRVSVIATLQVTSHSIAAALGFVWTVRWLLGDVGLFEAISGAPITGLVGAIASIALAIAAGWLESVTLQRFGL